MYKHSHSAVVFDYKNKNKYGYADFMNSYYHAEYHWSKCGIEMSKLNKSKSDEFLISGPIWSSQKFIKKNNITNISSKNTIAFFTTQFLGYFSINSLQAHEKFLLLALEIIKNYPDFKIILKAKFDPKLYGHYLETRDVIKKLSESKNFEIAKNQTFSTNVSMASDIVISMPFASSGFEAMCLGKKSFYVDLMNTYKNSYYDHFRRLISHSSEQAIDNFKYWVKVKEKDINLEYNEMFENLGILNNTNNAVEIIKSRIINKNSN
jgi:polysaccharide biosynthesis PFTS motif protein